AARARSPLRQTPRELAAKTDACAPLVGGGSVSLNSSSCARRVQSTHARDDARARSSWGCRAQGGGPGARAARRRRPARCSFSGAFFCFWGRRASVYAAANQRAPRTTDFAALLLRRP